MHGVWDYIMIQIIIVGLWMGYATSKLQQHTTNTLIGSSTQPHVQELHWESRRNGIDNRRLLSIPSSITNNNGKIAQLTLYHAGREWQNSTDPQNDIIVNDIVDDMILDLSETGTLLSIVAEIDQRSTLGKAIKRVVFVYDSYERIEPSRPYSMDGDQEEGRYLIPVHYLAFAGKKNITLMYYDRVGTLLGTDQWLFQINQTPKFPSSDVSKLGPFLEENGLLVMEAESVPQSAASSWFYENDLMGYTGTGYYRFNGNSYTGGGPKGRLIFHFWIQNPGRYQLLIRSNKNHPNPTWSNDCYTRLMVGNTSANVFANSKSNLTKTFQSGSRYQWSSRTRIEIEHGVTTLPRYTISKIGQYQLEIWGRSKNFMIDRIVLFHTGWHNAQQASNLSLPESVRVLPPMDLKV
jgi:Gylcosyl hydrolase family 115 C-terminal domain